MKTYRAGALAYLDTVFSGLVPVKAVEVTPALPGRFSATVTSVVTEDRGEYSKGQTVSFDAPHTVPRKHIVKRGIHLRVRGGFRWE